MKPELLELLEKELSHIFDEEQISYLYKKIRALTTEGEPDNQIAKRKIEEYKIARDKMYGDNGREESDCYLQDMIEWLDKGEEIDRCYKRSIK